MIVIHHMDRSKNTFSFNTIFYLNRLTWSNLVIAHNWLDVQSFFNRVYCHIEEIPNSYSALQFVYLWSQVQASTDQNLLRFY